MKITRALRLTVASAALVAAAANTGTSQAPTHAARTVATSRRDVRAELAATLLNARRFDEAAAEYRRLLAADPGNRGYRLGLARALAWGDRPRDAERELLAIRDRRSAAVVEPLLRSVRVSIDATSAEAEGWLRESPNYVPYRVALARALVREDPHRAIAQFDSLRLAAQAGVPGTPPASTLIREQAAAMFDARMFAAARAEYDTLIAASGDAAAYVGRANAALAMHDTSAAEQDLERSVALQPTYDAYYLLASLARAHEDDLNARLLYDAARRAAPDAPSRREVAAATAELAREQRPLIAFEPNLGGDAGWSMTTQSAADNAHVSYMSVDASRAARVGDGFMADIDVGMRRIAQGGPIEAPAAATGTAASLGVARQVVAGRVMIGAAAHAGFVAHPGVATFGRGSLTLGAWLDAWAVGAGLSRDPAYESLFTPAVLSPRAGAAPGPALVANAATISGGGPVGAVDVAAGWTRTWLSDRNVGETIEADARVPLHEVSAHLFAVYEGTLTSYAVPTTLYWAPVHYTANAVGPELATRRVHGLSLSVRALAGFASEVERDTTQLTQVAVSSGRHSSQPAPSEQRLVRRSALQLSTGGQASYRASWWEGAADVAYGRARAGGYQRLSAAFTIRVLR